jgi:phosphopantetheinyl transferase
LKEAWLKARGTGITGALNSTTIDLEGPRLAVARDDAPGAWQLLEPALLPGYQLGLALRATEAPVLSCIHEPRA